MEHALNGLGGLETTIKRTFRPKKCTCITDTPEYNNVFHHIPSYGKSLAKYIEIVRGHGV